MKKSLILFLLIATLQTARADFYLVSQDGNVVNVVTDATEPLKPGQTIAPCTPAQAQAAADALKAANPFAARQAIAGQLLALFATQSDPVCIALCRLNKAAIAEALNDPTVPLSSVKAMVAAIAPQNAASVTLQQSMLALFP